MNAEKVLTPKRFQDLMRRHLIVRANIQKLPASTLYPNGALLTHIRTCSFHRDEDGNEAMLEVRWKYQEPCNNYKELIEIEVRNFWQVGSEVESNLQLSVMLAEWKELFPFWMHTSPEIAYTNLGGKITNITYREMHVLQHLARFQAAVAATTAKGHTYQYYLCSLVYSLGSFIEGKNRLVEKEDALMIQTPSKYS